MNTKFILIILGEPYSTFSEIIGKYFRSKRFKKYIISLEFKIIKTTVKSKLFVSNKSD